MKISLNFILLSALFSLTSSCKNNSDIVRDISQPIKLLEQKDIEHAYPHWSSDGKHILFQSNISGLWQIYIMSENGTNLVQLTKDSSNNNYPDWSPNNNEICFVSDRTGNEEIFAMDVNGGNARQLTINNVRDIHPYWTPDGSKIIFNSTRGDSGDFEIYEMLPDGSSIIRLTNTDDNETCARLSPQKDKLVYLKNNDNGLDDLFIMDMKERVEINLTNTPTRNGWPCWMPNGNEILFSAVEDDVYKLFIYNLETKSFRRLTNPKVPYDDGRANISQDGKKIVFNRQVNGPKNTIGIYVLYLD
jgi:Tol biopolymer transport system component